MGHALLIAALAGALQTPAAPSLTLTLRIFNGSEDVTASTRVRVFRAGERQTAVAEPSEGSPAIEVTVEPGFYDAQAIRERDGRVLNIRWAERLVVMAYPDEARHHLEVINFQSGFGALEVRRADREAPDAALFVRGSREQEAAHPVVTADGSLFVAPAGSYDLRVRHDGDTTWHAGLDIPLDRTRFLMIR